MCTQYTKFQGEYQSQSLCLLLPKELFSKHETGTEGIPKTWCIKFPYI
jgi:hypothetical protein